MCGICWKLKTLERRHWHEIIHLVRLQNFPKANISYAVVHTKKCLFLEN